jgi:transposase
MLAFVKSGHVQTYPGKGSIFIMDGAKIHCHKNIVRYLRSVGIIPIFLPPYAPFFNPIELIFGYIKKDLKGSYEKSGQLFLYYCVSSFFNYFLIFPGKAINMAVAEAFTKFKNFNATRIFQKCGYMPNGQFYPNIGMKQQLKDYGFNV